MKNIFVIILMVSGFLSAQNRFQYQVVFKIDSLNRDFVQTELFNLDFADGETIFYPATYVKADSVMERGGRASSVLNQKIDFVVMKNHKTQEMGFMDMLGMMRLSTVEPRELKWKVINETKKVEQYTLQKAMTHFAGREWTAWFSKDVQIQDGPYKFKGLPGLVFSVEDNKKDYVFELINIQKIEKPMRLEFFDKLKLKAIKVDYEKFKKMKQKYQENPEAFFQQLPGFSEMPADELKNIISTFVERGKKQNNKIELSMN